MIAGAEIFVGTFYSVVDRTETFLHEIGHALGLGHLGPYNGSFSGSVFTNDTVQFSVMSYGRQNAFNRPATAMPVDSPAMADIAAMQAIYGAKSATRSGDTVYGFNSNAGAPYDFVANPRPNFTLYDGGGIDAIDASGFAKPQTIDLNPGHWSSIGGARNNIGIYLDSVIEDAIGGSNADVLIGNASDNRLGGNAGNDVLRGGGGNDTLLGGAGNDKLFGGDGDDRLHGGVGRDVLTGDAGVDLFMFDVATAGSGKDVIKDFVSGTDQIAFAVSAFTGLAIFGPGPLDDGELTFGKAATAADDRLIYNSANGALYYDEDGASGAAQVWIATLSGKPDLAASDVILI